MTNGFRSTMKLKFSELNPSVKKIVNEVWEHRTEFVRWPAKARLLLEGRIRLKYHVYPDENKQELKEQGIAIDSRSNGPAIMSFLLAGGKRPKRVDGNKGWAIHHIYNRKFPFTKNEATLHAVKDGNHFTQSAGLVAVHPIAHALADEHFYFVWLLRQQAFLKFNYDPDMVFCKRIDEYGFKTTRTHIYPPKERRIKNIVAQRRMTPEYRKMSGLIPEKLLELKYTKKGRNSWIKRNQIVHVVRFSNFGRYIRIVWKEAWKDDHAIIYNYSGASGPICVVPIPVLFELDFVKEKRESIAYANSRYWWSQKFPRNHELAKLVLSFEDRWDLL